MNTWRNLEFEISFWVIIKSKFYFNMLCQPVGILIEDTWYKEDLDYWFGQSKYNTSSSHVDWPEANFEIPDETNCLTFGKIHTNQNKDSTPTPQFLYLKGTGQEWTCHNKCLDSSSWFFVQNLGLELNYI